ncbi:MAG: hypothetical protein KAX40_12225 [Herpetosiphon sp.]|nr:hypothetical protein [Herpetosiphon sp.]
MLCPECDARLPQNATHCLECGAAVTLSAPPPVHAQRLPPLPLYTEPTPRRIPPYQAAQPLAPVGAVPYEPSILQQWLERTQRGQVSQLSSNVAIQFIYFVLVGIWFSQLWMVLAWLVSITVIGLPLANTMLRFLPMVTFLSTKQINLDPARSDANQTPPFGLRVLYFAFAGWWLSLVWLQFAWIAGITIIGLPIAEMMIKVLPTITTLRRL